MPKFGRVFSLQKSAFFLYEPEVQFDYTTWEADYRIESAPFNGRFPLNGGHFGATFVIKLIGLFNLIIPRGSPTTESGMPHLMGVSH